MQTIKLIFAGLILFLGLSINTGAQSIADMAKARDSEKKAMESYRAKDLPAFLSNMQQAGTLRPNHPRLMYNLAAAYAANGKAEDSFTLLKRMAAMGLAFTIRDDADFESLGTDRRAVIETLAATNKKPVNASTTAFTLPEEDFIPEGVTHDPKTGRFYVGSTHKAKIVVVEKNGAVRDFSVPADGLWSVAGMAIDAKRRILWACINVNTQMNGFEKSMEGRAGIAKYDLKTGKLVKKYLLPESEKHVLGDLTIDNAGNVYATDSNTPTIYRLSAGSDSLTVFLNDPEFESMQGLAFDDNDKTLFVADYSKGIFKIDIDSKRSTLIKNSDAVVLLGIDGLYYRRGNLIAIQNGMNPNRILTVKLDPTQTSILSAKVLEANHADFNEPTLGVVAGNDLYYIANSQLAYFTERALRQKTELKKPVILKVKLN